jgi:hypothetical protein
MKLKLKLYIPLLLTACMFAWLMGRMDAMTDQIDWLTEYVECLEHSRFNVLAGPCKK